MKLFGERAIDYFRCADPDDRRYLLYNPITKMKVTTEGERVVDLLWDVIAAQGLREGHLLRDGRARHPRAAQARGHGAREHGAGAEVHAELPLQPGRVRAGPDAPGRRRRRVPLQPGPDPGAGQDPLPRLAPAYEHVRRRPERRALHRAGGGPLRTLLATAPPGEDQQRDLGLPAHPRRALHARRLRPADPGAGRADRPRPRRLDQIFDIFVRDFSAYAIELHGKASTTEAQQAWALEHVRKPVADAERFGRVFEQVEALAGAYEMRAVAVSIGCRGKKGVAPGRPGRVHQRDIRPRLRGDGRDLPDLERPRDDFMAQFGHDPAGRFEALGSLVGDQDAKMFGTVGRQVAQSVACRGSQES